MYRQHIEQLRPVCPACRASGRAAQPLRFGAAVRVEGDDILEGALVCPEPMCQREHPIIDGIAILVSDIGSLISHQLDGILRRDDLSPFIESILGDAAGPGTVYDRDRINLSGYGRGHWGDFDQTNPMPREGALASLIDQALALGPFSGSGPWIDVGCSVGRGTFELARRREGLVAGIDLNFSMLRVAEQVRRRSRAVFPLKRVGLVYDRCELAIPEVPRERMGFWCCDAGNLPFADGLFAAALSMNVLDCVPSPMAHLSELGRILRPGAPALLCTPYDWSPNATPVSQWLGGHSQRTEMQGSSSGQLRRLLCPGSPLGFETGLAITAERDRVPWRVYMNERASTDYEVHLVRAERAS